MCLVDSSTTIDIESGEMGTEYKCMDCDTRFRALGKKITCPSCQSTKVKRL